MTEALQFLIQVFVVSITGPGGAWIRTRCTSDQLCTTPSSHLPATAPGATRQSKEDRWALGHPSFCAPVCWHTLWTRATHSVLRRYSLTRLMTNTSIWQPCYFNHTQPEQQLNHFLSENSVIRELLSDHGDNAKEKVTWKKKIRALLTYFAFAPICLICLMWLKFISRKKN